jgi:hypothetical protein
MDIILVVDVETVVGRGFVEVSVEVIEGWKFHQMFRGMGVLIITVGLLVIISRIVVVQVVVINRFQGLTEVYRYWLCERERWGRG